MRDELLESLKNDDLDYILNVKEKADISDFLKDEEVKDELKKVKWLSKEEMVKYTVAAVIFIVIFGLYFYGMDFIFSWLKGLIG